MIYTSTTYTPLRSEHHCYLNPQALEENDGGIKTRDVGQVFLEVQQAIEVHEKAGGFLGGVHFELTGDNVTECVGGPEELREADLGRRYQSFCDPRLNYAQSLEMAFLLAGGLSQKKRG